MRRVLLAVAVLLLLTGCGKGGSGAEPDRTAGVYEAVLSAVAATEASTAEGAPLPVVYALAGGSEHITAGVQVEVVKGLKDGMDLRFADERAEAVAAGTDGEPVRDDGLLVTLGPVPETGTRIEVPVELYRTTSDRRAVVVTLTQSSTGWTVSSVR